MKKLLYVIAAFIAITVASCGNGKGNAGEAVDSLNVDSVEVVDSTVVADSAAVVDSIAADTVAIVD